MKKAIIEPCINNGTINQGDLSDLFCRKQSQNKYNTLTQFMKKRNHFNVVYAKNISKNHYEKYFSAVHGFQNHPLTRLKGL